MSQGGSQARQGHPWAADEGDDRDYEGEPASGVDDSVSDVVDPPADADDSISPPPIARDLAWLVLAWLVVTGVGGFGAALVWCASGVYRLLGGNWGLW